jgi:hypothetical protein
VSNEEYIRAFVRRIMTEHKEPFFRRCHNLLSVGAVPWPAGLLEVGDHEFRQIYCRISTALICGSSASPRAN